MILVCGEALMDVFTTGHTPTGLTLDARIGGSPFNVALGLSRLGQRCVFFGGVSDGFLGDRLMQFMADEGIGTQAVVRLAAPMTLSLVGVGADGQAAYEFLGAGAADRSLTGGHLAAVPAGIRALHVGSYCTVVDPTAAVLQTLIERESARVLVSYDANLRPSVEPRITRWRSRFESMARYAHLIKLSDEDLGLLYPGEDAQNIANECLQGSASLVVLTRGSAGATAWTRTVRVDVPAPSIRVVDTVGAGDTFQAAMLTWLSEHDHLSIGGVARLGREDLKALLEFGVAAAAITCQRRGADLPRRSMLPS